MRDSKSVTSIMFLVTFVELNKVTKVRGLMWCLETVHITEYLVVIFIIIIMMIIIIIIMIIIIIIMMILIIIIPPSLP